MPIRKTKPTSPGRRFATYQDRSEVTSSKPKRRGLTKGRTRAWKKAIVQLAPGERIELFEGAETA